LILTNPPFGTDICYNKNKKKNSNGLLEEYEKNRKNNNDIPEFKEHYPIESNDGTLLFLQHCVFRLKEGGWCSIVLPEGELFNSKNKTYIKFRKWLCENASIKKIIYIPKDTFEHTSIKTAVMIFQKLGQTTSIEFCRSNEMCDTLTRSCIVSIEDIIETNYILDEKKYIIDENFEKMKENSNCQWVRLGDVCRFNTNIIKHDTSHGLKTGKYKFYTGVKDAKLYVDKYDINWLCIIQNRTNGSGKCNLNLDTNFSVATQTIVYYCDNELTTKYVYYYLLNNIYILENGYIGSNHKNISIEFVSNVEIPLPSLEAQQEIAFKLEQIENQSNTLKLLIEQTKIEIKLFQKYETKHTIRKYIKNMEWVKLEDVCKFKKGKPLNSKDYVDGIIPVIGGSKKPAGLHNVSNTPSNTILCSSSGYYSGHISMYPSEVWATDCFTIIPKNENILMNKYLYFFLKLIQDNIYNLKNGGGPGHVYEENISSIEIPLPSLDIQEQLILIFEDKLKRLEGLNNELELYKNKIK